MICFQVWFGWIPGHNIKVIRGQRSSESLLPWISTFVVISRHICVTAVNYSGMTGHYRQELPSGPSPSFSHSSSQKSRIRLISQYQRRMRYRTPTSNPTSNHSTGTPPSHCHLVISQVRWPLEGTKLDIRRPHHPRRPRLHHPRHPGSLPATHNLHRVPLGPAAAA
jgi:hypothetical protein